MITVERKDAILILTLNRPEKRNSLHPELISAMGQALKLAESDESVAVIIVTGAGKTFSAGLDLDHLLSLDSDGRMDYLEAAIALFDRLYKMPQPVIAAVNGAAMAGGFDLAAFCDLRLCSDDAIFAQTEVILGITQIMYPLYKVIGLGRAKELALTGAPISAEEAYRIGLVNHVYPKTELLGRALDLASVLASRPREALFETKRLSRELIGMDTERAFKLMFDTICERLQSNEHRDEVAKYVVKMRGGSRRCPTTRRPA